MAKKMTLDTLAQLVEERAQGIEKRIKNVEEKMATKDLVVEVLSNSNASRDRGEKKAIYERNGVREYWLVDPLARTLTAFILMEGRYGPTGPLVESERYRSPILGLELEVKALFPELPE